MYMYNYIYMYMYMYMYFFKSAKRAGLLFFLCKMNFTHT